MRPQRLQTAERKTQSTDTYNTPTTAPSFTAVRGGMHDGIFQLKTKRSKAHACLHAIPNYSFGSSARAPTKGHRETHHDSFARYAGSRRDLLELAAAGDAALGPPEHVEALGEDLRVCETAKPHERRSHKTTRNQTRKERPIQVRTCPIFLIMIVFLRRRRGNRWERGERQNRPKQVQGGFGQGQATFPGGCVGRRRAFRGGCCEKPRWRRGRMDQRRKLNVRFM